MNRSAVSRWLMTFSIWLSCFIGTFQPAQGQISEKRIHDLEAKYDWGGIYLTYSPICDLTQLLARKETLERLSSSEDGSVSSLLSTFLERHKAVKMSDGIAFLQINLKMKEAGFMKPNNYTGRMERIPWSPSEVLKVALFLDKFLVGGGQFRQALREISDKKTGLSNAWSALESVHTNQWIPIEKAGLVTVGLRILIAEKPKELAALKESNPSLYKSLKSFQRAMDTEFYGQLYFFREPDWASPRLATRYDGLVARLENPEANPYADPTIQLVMSSSAQAWQRVSDQSERPKYIQMGTWKLNEAKSKLAPGVSNTTVVYEAVGDSVKVTVDGVDSAGNPSHNEWTGKFDGKFYPVTGDPTSDERSYQKVNNRTLALTAKKAGKVSLTGRIVVSDNGRTRTVTTRETGSKVSNRAVYDKE